MGRPHPDQARRANRAAAARSMIAKIIALGWIGSAAQFALPEAVGQHTLSEAWSPTPFQPVSASATVQATTSRSSLPNNSLHQSTAGDARAMVPATADASSAGSGTKEALIQRWKKLDNPARSMPESTAYARPLSEPTGGTPAALNAGQTGSVGDAPSSVFRTMAPHVLPQPVPSTQAALHPDPDAASEGLQRAAPPSPVQAWRAAVGATPVARIQQTAIPVPETIQPGARSDRQEEAANHPRLNLIPSSPEPGSAASEPSVALTSYYQSESPSQPAASREPMNAKSPPASSANRWVERAVPATEEVSGSSQTRVRAQATSQTRMMPDASTPRSLLVREASLEAQDAPQLPPPAVPSVGLPPALAPKSIQPAPDRLPPESAPVLNVPQAPNGVVPPAVRNAGEPPTRLDLGSEATPPKRALEPLMPNPFPKAGNQDSLGSPSDRSNTSDTPSQAEDLPPTPPSRSDRVGTNCDAIRTFAAGTDIRNVKVDSSPSFVQGYQGDDRRGSNTKDSFVKKSRSRVWRSETGEQIAEGRLVDLVFGTVIIEREDGARVSYLQRKLSDPDQVFVAESWGVPITCTIGSEGFPERHFAASTMTWKASGACHKPLYFEDVQLERYGHEWGPVVQPVASTLRFFGDIAILPYKMGIHPPNECQYPLGYYRPGSCAPWTLGPVPISLRGAVEQAKVVTGAVFILP